MENRFNAINTETRGRMPLQWVLVKPKFKFLRQPARFLLLFCRPSLRLPSWPLRLNFLPLIHCTTTGDSGCLSAPQKLQSTAAWVTLSRAASGPDSDALSRPGGLGVNLHWNGQVSFFILFFSAPAADWAEWCFLLLTWPDLPWLTALLTYRGWTVTNSRAGWSHRRGFGSSAAVRCSADVITVGMSFGVGELTVRRSQCWRSNWKWEAC